MCKPRVLKPWVCTTEPGYERANPGNINVKLTTAIRDAPRKSLGLHIKVRIMLCNCFIDRRGEGIKRVSNLGSIDVEPN